MKFDDWLSKLPIQQTPKGARLDLRLYVYPDGHGDFCAQDESGRICTNPQPVDNPAEARDVLERIWDRAMTPHSASGESKTQPPTVADQFADLIGTAPDLPSDMAQQHDHYIHGVGKS